MAIEALLVDVDGVLAIQPDGRRWDADILADLGLDPGALQSVFFASQFRDCVLGKADLHDRLALVLPDIAPALTPGQLTDYWFEKDGRLDHALLSDLATVRERGLPMHLATVQEHRRAAYLWDTLGFRERFDECFHSARIGAAKPDPAYFEAVAAVLGHPPGALLLIDDSVRNVEAARACGWRAELWRTGESDLAEVLARHGF